MMLTVEYVLTHAQDTIDHIARLEADVALANARIRELQTPPPLKKRWWQK